MTEAEFDAIVDESLAYMHRAIEDCNRDWDFQSYQRWDIDLDRRVLVFSDGPRPPIDCGIQVAGVYMTNRDFWRWSWHNPSIDPALRTELEKVRAFGEANGIGEITRGGWPAQDEEAAWAMTALATKLVGAKSVHRAPDEPRQVSCSSPASAGQAESQGRPNRSHGPPT